MLGKRDVMLCQRNIMIKKMNSCAFKPFSLKNGTRYQISLFVIHAVIFIKTMKLEVKDMPENFLGPLTLVL